MPRYLVERYELDCGYILYGVALSLSTPVPVPGGLEAWDYLPLLLRPLYRPASQASCALVGVSPRSLYLWAADGSEHSLECPLSARTQPDWNQVIAALTTDPRITRFRVLGERVEPYRLERLLAVLP